MVSNIPPALIAKVPVEVASEYRVFPIKEKGHALYLCMCDPTKPEKLQALAFRLSCSVQPCVVTEITLNYALERYYGLHCETRFLPVKSDATPDAVVVHVAEEKPSEGGGHELRLSRADFFATDSGEFARKGVERLPEIGPALAEAKTDADVLEGIKRFFGATFPETVVLSLLGASLVPIAATGLGLDPARLAAIGIALREDSVVPNAIRDVNLHHHKRATDPILRELCEKTGMNDRLLTVIPVTQSRGVRFLVVGGGVDMPTLNQHLPAVKRALGQITYALQIVRLRRQILESAAGSDGKGRAAG
jgi:hypothetical protein